MMGLERTSASTVSLLLNFELIATACVGGLFLREQIGRRAWFGVSIVCAGGLVLTGIAGAGIEIGALFVIAACLCWGVDNAITAIDAAIAAIGATRASLGASQNRLTSTINNLQNINENAEAARGRVQDTDFAAETAQLTKQQTLQQASTSVLAQANQLPSAVLKLLQ